MYSRSQGLSPEYSNISAMMTECLYNNFALISQHENNIYGHYITTGYLTLLICNISTNYFINSTINISWLVKRVIRYTGMKPKFCKIVTTSRKGKYNQLCHTVHLIHSISQPKSETSPMSMQLANKDFSYCPDMSMGPGQLLILSSYCNSSVVTLL